METYGEAPVEQPDELAAQEVQSNERLINTASGKQDGLDKCPKCGSAEVELALSLGTLRCLFCRHQWQEEIADTKFGFDSPVHELRGTIMGTGAQNVEAQDIITIHCTGCGAEVIINAENAVQARCHWCRQTLSLNEQIPNGAVPDAILPFKLTKEEAVKAISDFAGARQFFARKQFKREFKPDNVVGVYLPYMLVDGNLQATVVGEGEIRTRTYTKGTGDSKKTLYDADVYTVRRDFSLAVDDLTVESSEDRSNMNVSVNTNNIINTILPFDTKNAVAYNSNYLRGFTSEKRDLNIDGLKPRVMDQFLSIARARAASECDVYDRGVRWERERVEVHGSRWVSVYLPVWLYSYYETQGSNHFVHYIAVNARTGETMGSVPVNTGLLMACSVALGTVLTIAVALGLVALGDDEPDQPTVTYSQPAPYDPLQESSRF